MFLCFLSCTNTWPLVKLKNMFAWGKKACSRLFHWPVHHFHFFCWFFFFFFYIFITVVAALWLTHRRLLESAFQWLNVIQQPALCLRWHALEMKCGEDRRGFPLLAINSIWLDALIVRLTQTTVVSLEYHQFYWRALQLLLSPQTSVLYQLVFAPIWTLKLKTSVCCADSCVWAVS